MPTWDSTQYLRFAEQRTQPCRDLAAHLTLSPSRAIDLGCGPGNSTAVLRQRWPNCRLTGLDDSPAMIAAARLTDPGIDWRQADIAAWAAAEPAERYDVIFSNAALQWVPDHPTLYPRLLRHLAPGGALAVQVPGNMDAPAHEAMRRLAASAKWKSLFPTAGVREWNVLTLAEYYDVLAPHTASVDLWHTEYLHVMPDAAAIVDWYKGTGLRPFLDALPTDADRDAFTGDYLDEVRRAYPPQPDGRLLFPFRRFFLIATV